VAIIDGGSVGLVCAKNVLEEGMGAVIFEKTSGVGGLWQFAEEHMSIQVVFGQGWDLRCALLYWVVLCCIVLCFGFLIPNCPGTGTPSSLHPSTITAFSGLRVGDQSIHSQSNCQGHGGGEAATDRRTLPAYAITRPYSHMPPPTSAPAPAPAPAPVPSFMRHSQYLAYLDT
jgi:hypothetical protein